MHRLNGAKPLGQVAMSMKVSSVAYKLTGEPLSQRWLRCTHETDCNAHDWPCDSVHSLSGMDGTAGKKMNPHLIRDMIVTYLRGQEDVTEHELEVPTAVGVPPIRLTPPRKYL